MRVVSLLSAGFALVLVTATTCSGSIVGGVLNLIQFDNRENFISTNDAILGNIGDRLVGVLNVNTTNNPVEGIDSTIVPEITGVFDLTIEHFVSIDATNAFMLLRPTNVTGSEGILTGHTAGTALALYQGGVSLNATLDDGTKTTLDAFSAASDGTFFDDFGFGEISTTGFDAVSDWGDAGNGYWYAIVAGSFTTSGTIDATSTLDPGSQFFYGLEGLTAKPYVGLSNPSLPASFLIPGGTQVLANKPAATTFFDLTGKGDTQLNDASAGTTAADQAKFGIFSQDPARLQPVVPEPHTLMVWGGLLGLGALVGAAKRTPKHVE